MGEGGVLFTIDICCYNYNFYNYHYY